MRKKAAEAKETLGGKLLLLASAALLLIVIAGIAGRCGTDSMPAGTAEERMTLLRSLGYEPEAETEREKLIRLPEEFPAVLENYNLLQQSQGFDLKKYAGKEIRIYTCRLKDDGRSDVYSSLYVRKGRLIGGDTHSTAFEGYMQPLIPAENRENS